MNNNSTNNNNTNNLLSDVSLRMLCGGLAGMIAKTLTNPLERVKMLQQTGDAQGSILGITRKIIRNEGIWGLWAGNGANLLRVMPSKAVVFSSQDVYRRHLEGTHIPGSAVGFVSGGLAGTTATCITYPLDLVRGRIAGKLGQSRTQKTYRGVGQTLLLTVRDEGIAGLYKGVTPTLVGALPYVGIQFGTVGFLETLVRDNHDNNYWNPSLQKMVFGGIGGVTAGLITYPNDTVRRLLQLQGSRGTRTQFSGYWDCVRQTYREFGVLRFYRGLGINLVRMAPNTAVQFGAYELLKSYILVVPR